MSNSTDIVNFLKGVPLFKGLNNRQLKKLASGFVTRNFSTGDEMVKQGDGGVGIFIIVSGKAEAVREKADGDDLVVNTFESTDYFGELALLTEGPRTASVYARTDVECLVLARWDFLSLMKEDVEIAISVAQEVASRFRSTLDTLF